MSRKRSHGLCRLFRRRAIGRLAVQLCLFLMIANLVAPLAWANARGGDADGFVLCHVLPGGGADQPRDHSSDSALPHCPLCLVLNGSVATPPSGVAAIVEMASLPGDALPPADDAPPPGQTLHLRPSPRGPPAAT